MAGTATITYLFNVGGQIADKQLWMATIDGEVYDYDTKDNLKSKLINEGFAWVVEHRHRDGSVSIIETSHNKHFAAAPMRRFFNQENTMHAEERHYNNLALDWERARFAGPNADEQAAIDRWDEAADGLLERLDEFRLAVADGDALLAEQILGMIANEVEECRKEAVWRLP